MASPGVSPPTNQDWPRKLAIVTFSISARGCQLASDPVPETSDSQRLNPGKESTPLLNMKRCCNEPVPLKQSPGRPHSIPPRSGVDQAQGGNACSSLHRGEGTRERAAPPGWPLGSVPLEPPLCWVSVTWEHSPPCFHVLKVQLRRARGARPEGQAEGITR